MAHVCTKMIVVMMVAHLFTASAVTAAPATIEAEFSFAGTLSGDPISGSSSFSGLGDVFFFNEFIENVETGALLGPFRRARVSFDITDDDIHAAGFFSWACIHIPGCHPGFGSFQYQDSIIDTVFFLEAVVTSVSTDTTMAFFDSRFFTFGGPGELTLSDARVSGVATQIVGEPSIFVLLTSAIAVLGANGLKRRRSA